MAHADAYIPTNPLAAKKGLLCETLPMRRATLLSDGRDTTGLVATFSRCIACAVVESVALASGSPQVTMF